MNERRMSANGIIRLFVAPSMLLTKECACSNGAHDRLKMVVKSRLVNTPLLQV